MVVHPAWLIIVLVFSACTYDPNEPPTISYARTEGAPYDFFRPDTIFQLPIALSEISGLTVLDSTILGSIQDEDGILYLIDTRTGRVERQVSFGRPGDYEGIARVGDTLYVLRSDGLLLEIQDWTTQRPTVRQIATGIRPMCDAEGLTYDADRHGLLIACKQGTSTALKHFRQVFSYDLAQDTAKAEALFSLDAREIVQHPNFDSPIDRKLRAFLAGLIDLSGFTPSDIAIHPDTGRLYVLSSNQKVVVVLSPDGESADVWRIPDRYFPQPEGIAFLPDGTLFISNEGPVGRGTVVRLSPATSPAYFPRVDSLRVDTTAARP